MRVVYKDWDRYRGQAKRLALHIEKEFAAEKIYEGFNSCIKSQIMPEVLDWLIDTNEIVEY
jgi:hypothetical protein